MAQSNSTLAPPRPAHGSRGQVTPSTAQVQPPAITDFYSRRAARPAACPADATSTATCRAAAGPCDVAESCDGASDACPADEIAPANAVCRPSSDACDTEEVCDGLSIACSADTGLPDEDADGACDMVDLCPIVADPDQLDGDGDELGDACDPCTNAPQVLGPAATSRSVGSALRSATSS